MLADLTDDSYTEPAGVHTIEPGSGPFNLDDALSAYPKLEGYQAVYRQSRVAALPYGFVGAVISFLLLYYDWWLVKWGILPATSVEIPNSTTLLPTFMLGTSCAMLVGGSQFFLYLTFNAIALLTAAQESLTTAICSLEKEKDRDAGCSDLLRVLHAILLYCTGANFVVVKGDFRGRNRLYDSLLTFFTDWALVLDREGEDPEKIAKPLRDASSGMIRLTMARGMLNVAVRFGVRPGITLMPVLYFVQIFLLVTMSFRHLDSMWFSVTLMAITSYGMGVLMCVAKNNANCLQELAGDRSVDPADRIKRLYIKVLEQLKAKMAAIAARESAVPT